jgi:hypothetical protein
MPAVNMMWTRPSRRAGLDVACYLFMLADTGSQLRSLDGRSGSNPAIRNCAKVFRFGLEADI